MSILRLITNKQHNSVETLPDIISYILRNTATKEDYIYSPNIPIYAATVAMWRNKEVNYQWKMKGYYHIILSPRSRDLEKRVVMEMTQDTSKNGPFDSLYLENMRQTPKKYYAEMSIEDRLFTAGKEIADWMSTYHSGNYLMVMAMHFDTNIPHLHFIMDNIDYVTGKRLNLGRMELLELKQQCSLILINYGISRVRGGWQELTQNRNEPYHFNNGKRSFILKKSIF